MRTLRPCHAFQAAADRMGVSPQALAYFDDEPTFVMAARSVGMHARLFTCPRAFVADLRRLGVPIKTTVAAHQKP